MGAVVSFIMVVYIAYILWQDNNIKQAVNLRVDEDDNNGETEKLREEVVEVHQ